MPIFWPWPRRMGSLVSFCFNDSATTEIYTLSLHDALPICDPIRFAQNVLKPLEPYPCWLLGQDRKSTRLNSSHQIISYAVFCLKKTNIRNMYKHEQHHITTSSEGHKNDIQLRSTVGSLFFFNDTATTEIYTLSLHDALPI